MYLAAGFPAATGIRVIREKVKNETYSTVDTFQIVVIDNSHIAIASMLYSSSYNGLHGW
jgi:hypothetical protein